jgi:hypothetical protein
VKKRDAAKKSLHLAAESIRQLQGRELIGVAGASANGSTRPICPAGMCAGSAQ